MPPFTLQALAEAIGASFAGDGTLPVRRLAHPSDTLEEGALAIAFEKDLIPLLDGKEHAVVALSAGQEDAAKKFKGALLVKRPRLAIAKLTTLYARPPHAPAGVHPSAVVDPSAKLGKNVCIGPMCYVGPHVEIGENTKLVSQVTVGAHTRIGADCLFYAGVRLAEGVIIGNRVIVHYNSVIGSDGFSFVTPEPGSAETAKSTGSSTVEAFNTEIVRIYSLGAVVLGDDVEVGACTAIDRGTITHTRIGRGTKIDNQVQIAHNVQIGENCILCGNVGIAGSTQVGNRVVLAARSGLADHLRVGDDAVLMAASQLGSNLPVRSIYMGAPAMPRERYMDQMIHLARIKNMARRIGSVEEKLNALEKGKKE